MKKIIQITTTLMRMRPDPELDIRFAPAAPKIDRETRIPCVFLLQDLREKRHFRRLARKLTRFVALLIFYGIALLVDRDIPARSRAGQALSNELLQTSLAPSGVTFATGINDVKSFWDWFGNSFVAMVYSTTTSSGLPRTDAQLYTIGTRSKIIGGFHIIQQRYLAINSSSLEHKNDLCYSTLEAGKNQICFSTNGYSTDPFGSISSDSDVSSQAELRTLDMFQHSVNNEGVGGFQTYFLRSSTRGAAEFAKVGLMQSYGWIDDQTRSVEIVMPMYNVHLKTCSVVRLTVEFDLTGGVTTSSYIHVMNTQAYNLHVTDNLVRLIYELLYAVLVGYFSVMEIWNIFIVSHGNLRKYAARFGLFETLSELSSITTNMTVVVTRWAIMTSPKRKLMETAPSLDYYAPLLDLAEQDDVYVAINILNVLILMIRVLKYFQVTDGGKRLLNSIVSAVPDIASFTPIYMTVMVCYTFAGHLLFGLTFTEWSTFTKAFCRVLEMNFGLYDPGPVYDASNFLGFFYISTASVVFCIIMLNVFLAIIMSTWDVFTEKELERTRVRERYREKMCFGDLVELICMRESVLDSLIASVLKMEEHATVSKQVFEQNWRASDSKLVVPSWLRTRILQWYWNSDDTPHVGPTAGNALQKSGSATTHAGVNGLSPLRPSSLHSLLQSKNSNTGVFLDGASLCVETAASRCHSQFCVETVSTQILGGLKRSGRAFSLTFAIKTRESLPACWCVCLSTPLQNPCQKAAVETMKYAPSMKKIPSFMRNSAPLGNSVAASISRSSSGVPRDFLLRDLKEKRKFRLLSRKLTVFVTFVTVYLAVLLLDRNISGRSVVRRIISKELIETTRASSGITFATISSIGTFWDWFANSFFVSVYSVTNSDGLPRSADELYTIASHTKIVGGFHIIQSRYIAVNTSVVDPKDDPCNSYLAPTVNQTCFSSKGGSTDSFGVTNGTAAGTAELRTLEMFQYSMNNDSVGGFQTYFLRSTSTGADEELATVQLMRSYRWIDRQTKSVEITMPMYNSNLKIWSIVNLNIGFDLAGGVTPASFIHVTNLEPYNLTKTKNVIRVVLEVIFILHVIYFMLLEAWDLCVLSSGSLRTYVMKYGLVNNLGDWANIAINLAIIIWRYFCQSNSTRAKMLAITSFDEYVSALSLAKWDDVLLVLNVCNMLLLTGRALKYFQVTNGGRRLMNSVYGAMPEVLSFLPIYVSVIIGYTFVGHMLYGLSFPEWSTFPRAFFRVFELNFGLYDPGPIYDAGGYLSAIFIYTSNIVFCILMLNVFMAIVMSTWENLSEREAEKATEREQFSRKLGPIDLVVLIFMKEDVVDLLIDVAQDLEGHEFVTKHTFTEAWKATGIEVSVWTWGNIISWYWEAKAPDLIGIGGGGSGDHADEDRHQKRGGGNLGSTSPHIPVKQAKELLSSDDLVVVKSARSIDSSKAIASSLSTKHPVATKQNSKVSAKVFAVDADVDTSTAVG